MRSFLRLIFTPWVLAGALFFGLFLILVFILVLWFSRPKSPLLITSTAIIQVTRVPSATPTIKPTDPMPTMTPGIEGPADSSDLVIGASVMVFGTGGTGLRVRQGPGLSQGVKFLADESEVFQIQDGPVELDGYTWWNLVSPDLENRAGWAVQDYLRVTKVP